MGVLFLSRYEQARTMVMVQNVRRQTDIETIQTVLFLVLRDQGRGKESQAWLLMGECLSYIHCISSVWPCRGQILFQY